MPKQEEIDALVQDVEDIVDRMEIAYKGNWKRASEILANALGVTQARVCVCSHGAPYPQELVLVQNVRGESAP